MNRKGATPNDREVRLHLMFRSGSKADHIGNFSKRPLAR
jgi:hypothetical protein